MVLNVQLDSKRNPGIRYILPGDGGVTNPALEGLKRTNRENEVRRDQTDESSKLESSQIRQVYKSKECRTTSNRASEEGAVPRGGAHNLRVGKGGEELAIKGTGRGEG